MNRTESNREAQKRGDPPCSTSGKEIAGATRSPWGHREREMAKGGSSQSAARGEHEVSAGAAWPTGDSMPGGRGKHRRAVTTSIDLLALVALTVVLLRVRPWERDFWFTDAARHALDGVFVLDFVRQGGLARPYEYALCYHARFPALGVAYYPPAFALTEACAYLLFGVGYLTARSTVVFYGLVWSVAAYVLGRRLHGRWLGLLGATAFLTMPASVRWAREVMLELPTCAMIALTVLFLHEWVDRGKRWAAYACTFSALGAVFTKQPAAFVILLVPLYALVRRRPRLLISKEAVACAAIGLAVLVPYLVFQAKVYPHAFRSTVSRRGASGPWTPERWLFFFKELPSQVGWPALLLSLVGLIGGVWRRGRGAAGLLLAWLAVGYLFTAYAIPALSRYLYLLLPSLGFLVAYGAVCLVPPQRVARGLWTAAVGVVIGYQVVSAAIADVPSVSDGIRRATALVVSRPRGETVLYHGYLSGNFAYHMRVAGGPGAQITLRSDKLFGRLRRVGGVRFEPNVRTPGDVARLLEQHGVGHVVIEPGDCSLAKEITGLLKAVVANEPWVLRARIPLTTVGIRPIRGDILIYENPQAGAATARTIPMWIPLSEQALTVSYDAVRSWAKRGGKR